MICINFVHKVRCAGAGFMETFCDARKAIGRFDITTEQEAGRMLGERHEWSAAAARGAGVGGCAQP